MIIKRMVVVWFGIVLDADRIPDGFLVLFVVDFEFVAPGLVQLQNMGDMNNVAATVIEPQF
ncbi:hypothetical protein FRUB_07002 [Fimbriiglobus ruber]|uniref:Uncharacterized protein n=1 Tax=Fimbriiglobus ruber TaxID=1908690 RepID=A0A225D8V0_9BACT|nr:hypothetical protein FRUB_07002 [Fimbriiglobus ruber]